MQVNINFKRFYFHILTNCEENQLNIYYYSLFDPCIHHINTLHGVFVLICCFRYYLFIDLLPIVDALLIIFHHIAKMHQEHHKLSETLIFFLPLKSLEIKQ